MGATELDPALFLKVIHSQWRNTSVDELRSAIHLKIGPVRNSDRNRLHSRPEFGGGSRRGSRTTQSLLGFSWVCIGQQACFDFRNQLVAPRSGVVPWRRL